MSKKSWFSIKKSARENAADISILSDIGDFGVTAFDFNEELKAVGDVDVLNIAITSNGGDISQGFAIYNMLAGTLARKVVTVNGLAASMASVIAMVGDERIMPKNSMLMIHNPWGAIMGSADEISSFGDALAKMRLQIVDAYKDATGLAAKKIVAMMDRETWLDAAEAKALGFITKIAKPAVMNAQIDISNFHNVPQSFGRTMKELAAMAKDKANESSGDENEAVQKTEADIRKDILESQAKIRTLCGLAGKPELADKFITDNTSVDDVMKALGELREKEKADAEKKAGEVSGRNNPRAQKSGEGEGKQPVLDPGKIYGHWNSAGKKKSA